jgi:hypothetical protein
MRKEFDQHMRDLRMARDREEFEQFMATARRARTSQERPGRFPKSMANRRHMTSHGMRDGVLRTGAVFVACSQRQARGIFDPRSVIESDRIPFSCSDLAPTRKP